MASASKSLEESSSKRWYTSSTPLSLLEFSSSSSPVTFAALKMGTQSNDLEEESMHIANDEAAVIMRPKARKRPYASDQDLFQGLMCPVFRAFTAKDLDAVSNNSCTTPRPIKSVCRGSATPDIVVGGEVMEEDPIRRMNKKTWVAVIYLSVGFLFSRSLTLIFVLNSLLEQNVDTSNQPKADARQPFSVVSQMPISQSKAGDEEDEKPSLLTYGRTNRILPCCWKLIKWI
jgi:hypothetical protein